LPAFPFLSYWILVFYTAPSCLDHVPSLWRTLGFFPASAQPLPLLKARIYEVPVDQIVDNGLYEIGSPVLVVEVVSVLPDVHGQ
jgi:hypothetical protein